jgi:DNA-binding MarR family transcriptional regulator
MDTARRGISARAAARDLGTSAPRVLRAIERLKFRVERTGAGHVRLTAAQLDAIRAELGSVPGGAPLPLVQLRLLAALDRAPRGVSSVRALASRAGISPTAAAAHLDHLKRRGLVREETRWVAEGRARERTVLSLDDGAPTWRALAPIVRQVALPARRVRARPPRRVPHRLDHLFWNVASSQKDVATAGPVIARRLIESSDLDGLAWGLDALSPADWEHAARTRSGRWRGTVRPPSPTAP